MHVVMITNAVAPDKLGGLERYVRELSATLVRFGVDVTIVSKRVNAGDPLIEMGVDGVKILRYAVPTKDSRTFAVRYPFSVSRAVGRALREFPDAVLHAHFAVPAIAPALRGRKYLYTCHAPVYRELLAERQDSYSLPRIVQAAAVEALRRTERTVLRRASEIVVLSDFVRNEVAHLDATIGARAVVVPGGLDTERFAPLSAHTNEALGLSEECVRWSDDADPLLVVARRLVPRTGVLELVQAMPAVLRAHPRAKLVVTGDGLSRSRIESEVASLGLDGAIRLVGRVTDEALISWYRRADLAVTPTQELEGFGLSTSEAMACGTPVLATPVGANAEVVNRLSSALVTSDRTPEAIATALSRLISDRKTLGGFAKLARESVLELSWDKVAARHIQLYEGQYERREKLA